MCYTPCGMKKSAKRLKVGFDLDGVILYNPTRVARPIISAMKRVVAPNRSGKFYVPRSGVGKEIWHMLHASSMFIEPGYDRVKNLVKKNKIEGYIITARYGFLAQDFAKWQQKLEADKYFRDCFYNKKNEQPQMYKQRMIETLDLDVFIEDNWDIVNALVQNPRNKKRRIYWVYNIIDRLFVKYPYGHPSLNSVMKTLEKEL